MSTPRDDDALSWAGDDDPTLVAGSDDAAPAGARVDSAVTGRADLEAGRGAAGSNRDHIESGAPPREAGEAAASTGLSSAALISLGVLGGIYLLYTIGWLIGGLRVHGLSGLLGVASSVSVPVLVLAVAAPALWFTAAFVLTRSSRAWVRFAWLIAGAVLLVPWPFATLGTGL
ncbi:DNA polymerase III subunit gamma/tau [Microbacterium radiodurans]|uniref:DNA polymerase III subunit gamma/tau n=1 Tax=Microbacterium radiodurans TaxID=661398 RepID=A0A5J5IVA2_9MICO|nr:DNA polymerase III subunit gamma/tau [Microbacterium radiodurans]KAA9086952.1 DNA polymerase III subunit gamma/tau [Microbacterium radiodurans]